MNFPITRHLQRYEFLVESGVVDDKVVADVGCGIGVGSFFLTGRAKYVFGIDANVNLDQVVGINATAHRNRFFFLKENLFDFVKLVDVVVAIEVLEHVEKPVEMIKHISGICEYAFITTPLVEVTGKTRNKNHVVEYSRKDFEGIVGGGFDIVSVVYQLSDMSIVDAAKPSGDSLDDSHVVQMAWCRSKNGRK